MTSDRPAEITVLDPETLDRQRLPLVREPRDLTLDPSGHHAVVAYDGWIAHYALDPLRRGRPLASPDQQDEVAVGDAAQQAFDQRRADEPGRAGDGDPFAGERLGDHELQV